MMIKVRALSVAAVLAASMLSIGCGHYVCKTTLGASTCTAPPGGISGPGPGGTTGTPAAFAYFMTSGTISGAILDTSSNFGLIPNFKSPPGTLSGVGGMVIVQKKWMYVSLTGAVQILAESITGSTGALTPISGSPFSSANSNWITSDPAGKFLFVSGANNGQVTVFTINQTTGALTLVASYPTSMSFAGPVTTDGMGRFLYVTAGNLGTTVAAFSIGSSGALTPVAGTPFSISIAQLASEPTGKFLLGVTGNGANNGVGSDNHIYVYSIDQTSGALSAAAGSPVATTYIPASLTVHPNGTLVYTFNQTVSSPSPMEGFRFDGTSGALTAISGSPFTSLSGYAGLFDQNGAFLFIHAPNTLSVVSVNTTTGALSSVGQTLNGTGSSLGWAVTDPH